MNELVLALTVAITIEGSIPDSFLRAQTAEQLYGRKGLTPHQCDGSPAPA